MPETRIAVIDPSAGASGDMFLGALVACGYSTELLASLPTRLGLADRVVVSAEPVSRATIAATKVTVTVDGEVEAPGDDEGAGHHHHGPHRHVGELLERIDSGELSDGVKARSKAVFMLLAGAEGRVHGSAPKDVSLHEVGAWDALIDVVGAVEGFERLGVGSIHHRPPATGSGWVRAAHGEMVVPTPATSLLLEGLELAADGPVTGEAITPTGAALIRGLSEGPPPARWRPVAQGWGAGARDPSGYANVMRLFVAEAVEETVTVRTVVADIDDLSPEYLGPLREGLVAAGAIDVQMWPTMMKKGRSGLRVEAQCPSVETDRLITAFFRHSTTAGVRVNESERRVLGRQFVAVPFGGGTIRVKVYDAPDGPRYKAEFDDVAAHARLTNTAAHAVAEQVEDLARQSDRVQRNEEQQ